MLAWIGPIFVAVGGGQIREWALRALLAMKNFVRTSLHRG